ncbi:OTU domain-containing protein 5-A [Oopsacas minuta]|uniref:ubiquitinyl hydrolase 1 n=1 Tax=Oopsacas minuta TaxID=111878 RepID=A0AAV7KHT8_9METZ|nr:OTU domain-containing protein 5-A [Oopsacas minuta]
MTILPKKDKSDNSDSDGSNSSNTSTQARDAYQHTASCHNEDYDSASQSTACSVSRSKRRLRASVSTRPLQTARPAPLSLTIPLLPSCSASSSSSSSLPQPSTSITKPRKIPALLAAGYSSDECNSAEEYDSSTRSKTDCDREQRFEEYLWKEWGFLIKQMKLDGNCLFRSIADQIYGDEEMQSMVRGMCMDYMMKNSDYFAQFVTEDFSKYISRKSRDCCYGNHLEMQALSEMYNRNIEVYQFKKPPIVFYSPDATDNDPMRLSYHGQIHYNSIVDPKRPAVGVGLGLPGYKPSEEDKRVLERAIKESEEFTIEESMLKDKLDATEIEATNEAVEEAIARESYLIWLEETRTRQDYKASSSSVITQALSSPSNDISPSNSPPRSPLLRSRSLTNLNPILKPAQSPPPLQLPSGKMSPVMFKRQVSSPSLAKLRTSPTTPVMTPSYSDNSISFSRPKHSHKHSYKKLSSSTSNFRKVPYPSPKSSPHSSKHNSPTSSPSTSPRSSPLLSNPPIRSPQEQVVEKSLPTSSDPIYPFEYSSMLDGPSFGMSDWGDDSIIAAVMAASQQEYFQAQLNSS